MQQKLKYGALIVFTISAIMLAWVNTGSHREFTHRNCGDNRLTYTPKLRAGTGIYNGLCLSAPTVSRTRGRYSEGITLMANALFGTVAAASLATYFLLLRTRMPEGFDEPAARRTDQAPLHGVNLGGWLLLEKWITPSLFAGLAAKDEYSFCLEKPEETLRRLRRHRKTYITKQDFEWLAAHGINAVRLPVGYWALQDDPPFVHCTEQVDQAFAWASACGLKIILDLHGAPGSQNGQDHSGRAGATKWARPENIAWTLQAIEQFCERYGTHEALWGIELLNEPGRKIPQRTLRSFYDKGYEVVRRHCDERVAVIVSDAFKPLAWNTFLANPAYRNIVLDTHLYQSFSPLDKALSLQGHLNKTNRQWGELFGQISRPTIVGEWSLGLDPKTFRGKNLRATDAGLHAYAEAQLEAFKQAPGWFFWTYKTEDMLGWSYRDCVEKGLLPTRYIHK